MVSEAFRDINAYFELMDYQLIPTDSETVRMYAFFEEETLFLINVIELSEYYSFDKERYMAYREITKKQFANSGANKIRLLNLLLIENPDMIYKEINYKPDQEAFFSDCHWIIDTAYKELLIPRKQEKQFLDLRHDIPVHMSQTDIPKYKMHEKNKTAVVSGVVIISIMAIYMVMVFLEGSFSADNLTRFGAFNSGDLLVSGEIWRLLTYFIVHTDPFYMIISAFYIFFFGSKLEKYLKGYEMVLILLGSSVFAGIFVELFYIVTGNSTITAGGAAMAYGVIGSILVYSRMTERHLEGLHEYAIFIMFLLGIAVALADGKVNALLHVGGFIGGIILTLIILRNYKHQVIIE